MKTFHSLNFCDSQNYATHRRSVECFSGNFLHWLFAAVIATSGCCLFSVCVASREKKREIERERKTVREKESRSEFAAAKAASTFVQANEGEMCEHSWASLKSSPYPLFYCSYI